MKAVLKNHEVSESAEKLDIMIGRQPIYNDVMGVYGYELLFRSPNKTIDSVDPNQATAQVLTSVVTNFGLNNLVGKCKAAINITTDFLDGVRNLPFTYEQVILDLPDDLLVDEKILSDLADLSSLGFVLSIGGIDNVEKFKPLLSIVDIFRVDVQTVDKNNIEKLISTFDSYKNLQLLALKVETLDDYSYYRDIGFKYCQGYFLSKPKVYLTKDLPSNKLAVLNLLAVVNNINSDIKEIETIVTQDVSLSYKLLKLINSPFFGLVCEIESISQALVLLGRAELRTWLSLVALSGMDDRPIAMIELALVRAKMCELLAEKAKLPVEGYFTVGMFSALDILMESPLKNLISNLPLSDTIKNAILHKQGIMGNALKCALAYENAEWGVVRFENLEYQELLDTYMESITWTNSLMDNLGA